MGAQPPEPLAASRLALCPGAVEELLEESGWRTEAPSPVHLHPTVALLLKGFGYYRHRHPSRLGGMSTGPRRPGVSSAPAGRGWPARYQRSISSTVGAHRLRPIPGLPAER